VLVYPRDDSISWWAEHLLTVRFVILLWRSAFDVGVPDDTVSRPPEADAHLDPETRAALQDLERRRPEAIGRFRISELIEIHRALLATDPGTPVYHLGFLTGLVLHHEPRDRIEAFFRDEVGVDVAPTDIAHRERLIAGWVERTGDRFSGLRLAASLAALDNDPDHERSLLETPTGDPMVDGLAELRKADISHRREDPAGVRTHLLNADRTLPDDYQWSLLQGDIAFLLGAYDLAAEQFRRALTARPDPPPSHELVIIGRLANAVEQAGDPDQAARLRARRDELELGRFREFTRFHYRRVVDAARARGITVIAMQYPLLSVEALRKLLDDRDDVIYLENRENFERALRDAAYRTLFEDHFAGSFGHLTERGNLLLAQNVAGVVAELTGRAGDGAPAEVRNQAP
jgi:tetratricopeptide (TPR) repeat protein